MTTLIVGDGHYSRTEAARILNCSRRTLDRFISEGKLRKVRYGHRVFIPKEDVELILLQADEKAGPSRAEHLDLQRRLTDLEETVELLKAGLGYGSRKKPRTLSQLRLLTRDVLDHLARPTWTKRMMKKYADDVYTLRGEDVNNLVKERGPNCLTPYFELLTRMQGHCEAHEEWPSKSLELIRGQLIRGEDRLLGMLRLSSDHHAALERAKARSILKRIEFRQSDMDRWITDYVVSELEMQERHK